MQWPDTMDFVFLWKLSTEIHRLPWIITPDVSLLQRFRVSYCPRNLEPGELIIFWSVLKNYKWLDIERPGNQQLSTLVSITCSHSHTKMECLSGIH